MLRLPDGMRDKIKMEADSNGRSMNAEIVERLERSFDHQFTEDSLNVMLTNYERLSAEMMVLHYTILRIDREFGIDALAIQREEEARLEKKLGRKIEKPHWPLSGNKSD